jgi:predicted nucleic acid-binding protein
LLEKLAALVPRPRANLLLYHGAFAARGCWISIAEVLTGPLGAGNEALAERYRAVLESWYVVDLTAGIAERAARLRANLRLGLADAVQAASAIAVNADALVTHDRDFTRLRTLRVLG